MFDCFKKDYSKPSRDYGSHGEGDNFKSKWGYIVPHVKNAQGADTPGKRYSEYKYGQIVAPQLSLPWDDRDNGGVSGACARLKKIRGVNSCFEDHKNAYNGIVGGAEILVISGDALSTHKAEMILDAFHADFPDRNIRGVKKMRKGGRGYNNLLAAKKAGMDVALLGELFFIDNKNDFISTDRYAEFLKSVLI